LDEVQQKARSSFPPFSTLTEKKKGGEKGGVGTQNNANFFLVGGWEKENLLVKQGGEGKGR